MGLRGIGLAQKSCKKFHKGAQEHKSNEKTLTHIFINQKSVKYTIKQSKIYHESYRKNSRKLQENYSMPGVQIARK